MDTFSNFATQKVANLNEQKIVTLKYKLREFKKTFIDQTTETTEYAEIIQDKVETIERLAGSK